MSRRRLSGIAPQQCGRLRALVLALGLSACTGAPEPATLRAEGERVAVRWRGEPFADYLPAGHRRPIVWPLCAPGGIPVTRAFPMAQAAGEPHDHAHHESLWFAHGDVDGVDFWAGDGRIVEETRSLEPDTGTIRGASVWRDGKGKEICRDRHAYAFTGGADWRAVDLDLELRAGATDLRLGDTKEGTFALRLRHELCLRGAGAAGAIVNSEGQRGDAAWGKRARWVAYTGPVAGATVVVAVFDHPDNLGHPTFWHARDYGLVAANPFGAHDFAGAPPGSGARVVPAGTALRFRYRVLLARGQGFVDRLDALYRDWVAGR